MRRFAIASAALCILGAFSFPNASRDAQRQTLDQLAWLAGCWELRSGARLVEEQWMSPRGGLMLGLSRTARNDTIVEFEQIRIETRPEGIFFVASPSRQATAEFRSTSFSDSSIVFENPAHDFPKKITYLRQGGDSLVASIEGPRGGRTRSIAFPYRRVPCPRG